MEQWEYLTIELDHLQKGEFEDKKGRLQTKIISSWNPSYFTNQLNNYGSQGWELVGFFYKESYSGNGSSGTEKTFATFKRKKQPL